MAKKRSAAAITPDRSRKKVALGRVPLKSPKIPQPILRAAMRAGQPLHWLRHHYKWLLGGAGIVILSWLIFAISVARWYEHKHARDPYQPGVSFSVQYARELGVDWKANFLGLLEDLHFKRLRLMSYWDDLEPTPGRFNFADLDWQMDQAAKHGAKVSLSLGIRQPRWPECRLPEWAQRDSDADREMALMRYLQAVVDRYRHSPALESYQLENEIANRLFAPACNQFDRLDRGRLTREFQMVKAADGTHPVILNASNQSGVPVQSPVGDAVGFSIYDRVYARATRPIAFYWSFFRYTPPLWHAYRAGLVELLHHKPTFVHELQTEPWGPAATEDLSIAEQNKTMTAAKMQQNVDYAYATGMHRIYLWGGEWWYWRKTKFNDPTLWQSAKHIVATTPGEY